MTSKIRGFLVAACLLSALPAAAQQLQLDIKDGRVNLDATAVPVRQILAEWTRIGGTRIVGGDKITGAPLTIKLVDTPEREALDLILRNVAGYMAAPKSADATGASNYSRIMVLPTTSAPPAVASARPGGPGNMPSGLDRRVPRPPGMDQPGADDQPPPPPTEDGTDTGQPVFTFPQPGQPNGIFQPVPPGGAPFGQPGSPTPFGTPVQPGQQPVISLQPNANGQPTIYNFMPNNGMAQPGFSNTPGFTVIGSPTPGMIQQPPQPNQPGMPVKPPK
jgi:hypothetical protein